MSEESSATDKKEIAVRATDHVTDLFFGGRNCKEDEFARKMAGMKKEILEAGPALILEELERRMDLRESERMYGFGEEIRMILRNLDKIANLTQRQVGHPETVLNDLNSAVDGGTIWTRLRGVSELPPAPSPFADMCKAYGFVTSMVEP